MATPGALRCESRPLADLPIELRGRKLWHKSTPQAIVAAGEWTDDTPGWKLWSRHLKKRGERSPDLAHPRLAEWLGWSVDAEGDDSSFLRPLELCGVRQSALLSEKGQSRVLDSASAWLASPAWLSHSPQPALEALAWAYALPRLASALTAGCWWDLLGRIFELTNDDEPVDWQRHGERHLLLRGELRTTLAYLFPELKACRALAPGARDCVRQSFAELTSAEGLPHGGLLPHLRGLLATWTRSRWLAGRVKNGHWDAEMRASHRAVACQALRLLDGEGKQLLGSNQGIWPVSLQGALREAASGKSRKLITHWSRPGSRQSAKRLPDAASQSDAASCAVLRVDWKRQSTVLAVDYSQSDVLIELKAAGQTLLDGAWKFEAQINGAPAAPVSDWEAVCWTSDEDVVYLELQAELAGNYRAQRQILLARQDQFLWLNDLVFSQVSGEIRYRSLLPIAAGVAIEPHVENREVRLETAQAAAMVLPVALGEWRGDTREGDLCTKGENLEYSVSATARGMAAPLWIDLRQHKRLMAQTWRRLEVAEDRRVLARDEAVGFRVRVDKRQWLFYRALATRGVRTVLGAHTASEFLASRIQDEGELTTLIEIE